ADTGRDPPAVHRLEGEGAQHEHLQGALEELGTVVGHGVSFRSSEGKTPGWSKPFELLDSRGSQSSANYSPALCRPVCLLRPPPSRRASPPASDFQDQVQRSLGSSYSIDRELGGGGMSRVFVARDATLRRDVVVKVLPPDLVAGVNVERFRREILVAAGLQHPHIVPVLSSGETDGLPWFTMPFV